MNDNRASGQAATEPNGNVRLALFAVDQCYIERRTRLFWD